MVKKVVRYESEPVHTRVTTEEHIDRRDLIDALAAGRQACGSACSLRYLNTADNWAMVGCDGLSLESRREARNQAETCHDIHLQAETSIEQAQSFQS